MLQLLTVENVLVCIIMQRLTRRVSVIRMTNRRRGGHVHLRVAVIVIKRFQFLFLKVKMYQDETANEIQTSSLFR